MSRNTATARNGSDRASLYDETTAKIVAELEAGRVPWVQPWATASAKASLNLPRNAATGRRYSGINVLILWGAVIEGGYPAQSWLTFRQALAFGANVRKGERGTTVVYADRFVPDDERQRARDAGGEARAIPFLVSGATAAHSGALRRRDASRRWTTFCQQPRSIRALVRAVMRRAFYQLHASTGSPIAAELTGTRGQPLCDRG